MRTKIELGPKIGRDFTEESVISGCDSQIIKEFEKIKITRKLVKSGYEISGVGFESIVISGAKKEKLGIGTGYIRNFSKKIGKNIIEVYAKKDEKTGEYRITFYRVSSPTGHNTFSYGADPENEIRLLEALGLREKPIYFQ